MELILPELAAILVALVCASLVGAPGLRRAMHHRRRALRECLNCGRTLMFGERTCDCD